jgi:lysophospholipase L1-like esterase
MMWETSRRFLQQNDIKYIDVLPALQKQLEKGPQPYLISDDGHPNKYGYQAIAEAVFGFLKPTSFIKSNINVLDHDAAGKTGKKAY